jgi:hypothetical protein
MWLLEIAKIAIPAAITAIVGYLLGKSQTKKNRETLIESKSPRLKLRAVESVMKDENKKITLCIIEFKVQNVGFGPAFNIGILDCIRKNKKYNPMRGQPWDLTLSPGAPEQEYPIKFSCGELTNEDLKSNFLLVNTKCSGGFNNEIEQKFKSISLWDGSAKTYYFDLKETWSHVGAGLSETAQQNL